MQDETDANGLPIGSTMTPSQVRKLKIAIAIMSVMLVAGFILLLVGIYLQTQKMSGGRETGASRVAQTGVVGAETRIAVPAGTELRQILIERGQLILHLRSGQGDEIAIIDVSSGEELRRLKLAPQNSP
jgi:hypothetical protein